MSEVHTLSVVNVRVDSGHSKDGETEVEDNEKREQGALRAEDEIDV